MPARGSRNEIQKCRICLLLQDLQLYIDHARMRVADYDGAAWWNSSGSVCSSCTDVRAGRCAYGWAAGDVSATDYERMEGRGKKKTDLAEGTARAIHFLAICVPTISTTTTPIALSAATSSP